MTGHDNSRMPSQSNQLCELWPGRASEREDVPLCREHIAWWCWDSSDALLRHFWLERVERFRIAYQVLCSRATPSAFALSGSRYKLQKCQALLVSEHKMSIRLRKELSHGWICWNQQMWTEVIRLRKFKTPIRLFALVLEVGSPSTKEIISVRLIDSYQFAAVMKIVQRRVHLCWR